jgi:hypothetical protein
MLKAKGGIRLPDPSINSNKNVVLDEVKDKRTNELIFKSD